MYLLPKFLDNPRSTFRVMQLTKNRQTNDLEKRTPPKVAEVVSSSSIIYTCMSYGIALLLLVKLALNTSDYYLFCDCYYDCYVVDLLVTSNNLDVAVDIAVITVMPPCAVNVYFVPSPPHSLTNFMR